MDQELVYPVLISVNLLVTSPNKIPIPPQPIYPVESTPSTSNGQSHEIPDNTVDTNSNETEISTIGTTKSNNNTDENENSSLEDNDG